MIEVLQYPFMQNAVLAGVLAAVLCGVIGTLVVVNRLVMLSGGVAHAAYGGVGIAVYFGFAPLLGAAGFALASAAAMAWILFHDKHRADTLIGVLWAVGMAIGIVFIDRAQGYNADAMSFLFGSILAVTPGDLYGMATLTICSVALVLASYRTLLAMSFDEDQARLAGVPVRALYLLLVLLIALAVVVVVRVVGMILVIALFTIAPYIAETFARTLKGMMVLSCLLNVVFTMAGLALSWSFNLTSGAVIILVASVFFAIAAPWRAIRARRGSTAA